MKVNWNQLFGFYVIAREKSILRAAQKMDISNSTLSEQLKRLEVERKCLLIDRSPKKFKLTKEGQILYKQLSQVFEKEIFSENLPGDQRSFLTIGVVPGFLFTKSYRIVEDYIHKIRSQTYEIKGAQHFELEQALLAGDLDLGISHRPFLNRLHTKRISDVHFSFWAASNLHGKSLADLLFELPIALYRDEQLPSEVQESIYAKFRTLNLKYIVTDFPSLAIELTKAGKALTILPSDEKVPGLKEAQCPIWLPKMKSTLYIASRDKFLLKT